VILEFGHGVLAFLLVDRCLENVLTQMGAKKRRFAARDSRPTALARLQRRAARVRLDRDDVDCGD
jgi:hypothetical protein